MREINDHQKMLYEKYDFDDSKKAFECYEPFLSLFKGKEDLKILDIGGASGHFSMLLKDYFGSTAKIYVMDITEYDTWKEEEFGSQICFVRDTVENLGSGVFQEKSFDIIFANRVFHHLVDETWNKTLRGMENVLRTIHGLLREQGTLCILDHFYNGYFFDASTSWMIYHLTSIRNPVLSRFIKHLGAQSTGVGVCFLSEKMWIKLLKACGFTTRIHRSKYFALKPIKRIALLNKNARLDNIIYAFPGKRQ